MVLSDGLPWGLSLTTPWGQAMQSVILGTAQWGLDYGATNAFGRPSEPPR
jgi:hypothetical protein